VAFLFSRNGATMLLVGWDNQFFSKKAFTDQLKLGNIEFTDDIFAQQ
jgi:hypothetical protein